jgi:glycosyltransferase involved in cell wall biosynthesis
MKKLLMLVTLPPPIHGSNRINQLVVENPLLKDQFAIRVLPLNYVQAISEIGKFQWKKYLLFLGYWFRLLYLLITYRADAAYFVPCVSGTTFLRDCAYVLLLRLFRVRTILHLHAKGIADGINHPIYRRLYSWFFKNAWVVALSPGLYRDVSGFVSEDRVRYLPNGTDFDSGNEMKPKRCGQIQFLFLSNLVVTKGPMTLLEACRILKDQGLDFSTVFVGNPTKEIDSDLFNARIRESGLDDRVKYLGPKYGAEKCEILASSHVMVFPTFKDCFPLVLLEAMAYALPVISTFEGAIPEIVDDGQTGLLVKDRDPVALAAAMGRFIRQPDLIEEYGQRGKAKFQANYTLDAFRQRSVAIFSELMNEEARGCEIVPGESR